MTYAFSHLHAGWHAVITIGSAVVWVLANCMGGSATPSVSDRIEAERRGRERIMESYDKYDRRDDDE